MGDCDMMSPKGIQKASPELYETIKVWLSWNRTYTVRFGIGMLLILYLEIISGPRCSDFGQGAFGRSTTST
jgi:hypothetical protein